MASLLADPVGAGGGERESGVRGPSAGRALEVAANPSAARKSLHNLFLKQGCQIFLGKTYQNGGNVPK
jgi:hypothetical protein